MLTSYYSLEKATIYTVSTLLTILMLNHRLRDLSYLVFNFVSTVAVTFINKICFSKVEFGYPAALCNVHFAVTLLGVEIVYRIGGFEKLKPSLRDPNFLVLVLVVGVVTPLNNTSLQLNTIGFYQIFKLLVTPGLLLLDYFLDGKTLPTTRMACILAVCFFVTISSKGELAFNTFGTICASIWVPLAAAYKVQWGRVKKRYSCSTLALMHAVLPYAMVVQAAISPLVDPPGILNFNWTAEATFWIGLSGVFAFFVNFSGFLVMGNISGLAHVLLGQLKTAVIMLGAYFVFASRYSPLQMFGAIGAVVSIVIYTHVTLHEKNVQPRNSEHGESELQIPLMSNSKPDLDL